MGSAGLASFPNLLVVACPVACAQSIDARLPKTPNIVIQWDNAALQGVRDTKMGPPMVARALAIVHTCMYDAWGAYDDRARGTQLGAKLRQPHHMRTLKNKRKLSALLHTVL
jgi:hypothetical protein